jgi:hypothetical protein
MILLDQLHIIYNRETKQIAIMSVSLGPRVSEWVSDCCLTSTQQLCSYVSDRDKQNTNSTQYVLDPNIRKQM